MTDTLPAEALQAADAAFQDCRSKHHRRTRDCCLRTAIEAAFDTHAAEQWAQQQADQLGIRYADFRAGRWEMELSMAREMGAAYVAMAKALLGKAPNYSETKLEFDVKVAESPEMYTLVVQRHAPGALTPHEARQRAEARLERVLAECDAMEQAMARGHASLGVLREHIGRIREAAGQTTEETRP